MRTSILVNKFIYFSSILSALPLIFMFIMLGQHVSPNTPEMSTTDSQKQFRNSWLYLIMSSEYANHSKNFRLAAIDYLKLYELTKNIDVLNHLISALIASEDFENALLFLDEQLSHHETDDLLALKLALLFKHEIVIKDKAMDQVFDFHSKLAEKKVLAYLELLNFTPSQYSLAINIFRRERNNISLENPDEFLLYLMLASNSWDEALSQIKKFKEFGLIQADSADIVFKELLKRGSTSVLLNWVESLERKHGLKPHLLMMKAEIFRAQRKNNLALLTLTNAVKIFPKNNQLVFAKAVFLFDNNLLDEARNTLNLLLTNSYRRNEVYFLLGAIAEADKLYPRAVEHWLSITNYDTDIYFISRKKIAQLMCSAGQFDEALELLNWLQIDFPAKFIEIGQFKADLLINKNQFELAMTVLNDDLSKLDFDRDLVYTRALVADRLGKIKLLEKDLRKILSIFPNDADALNALGYSLTNLTSRYKEAYQLISKALEIKSDSFYILDSMGWVYFKLGDLERSIFYLEKAYELSQDDEITQHLVEALNANGDFEKARIILEKS